MGADEWLDHISSLLNDRREEEAVSASAVAIEAFPRDERLLRAHAIVLRRAARLPEAVDYLTAAIEASPRAAWAHAELGVTLQGRDSRKSFEHLRKALEIEPGSHNYRMALIRALTRFHGDSGEALEEAYQLLRPVLSHAPSWGPGDLQVAYQLLSRVCAFDELAALGDPMEIGRKWAEAGNHGALFLLLGRVRTYDYRELLPKRPDGSNRLD